MKKIIKVNKEQLQSLIQKEAVRQKRIIDLSEKRNELVQQLNEMYSETPDSEMDVDMDEGIGNFLNKASKYIAGVDNPEKRERYKQKFLEWITKMQAVHGEGIVVPEGQDLEDAVTAAIYNDDVKLRKDQATGKWVPISRAKGSAAGAFNEGESI